MTNINRNFYLQKDLTLFIIVLSKHWISLKKKRKRKRILRNKNTDFVLFKLFILLFFLCETELWLHLSQLLSIDEQT